MNKKIYLSPEQDLAANPNENVWVQANAGTGKTSVLVQRLLRIMFRTPELTNSGILCLTYTNAGAGEMRNRILSALRQWAMASDDELKDLLKGVSWNVAPDESDLSHAREIFFKYIDNPTILKIKTIHGFCEEILRRFPLEAGISPSWNLISDTNQRVLQQEAFTHLINTSNNENVINAFSHIVNRVSESYVDDLLKILNEQYKYFFNLNDIDKYRKYFIDTTRFFLNLDKPVNQEKSKEKLIKIIQEASEDINGVKKPASYLIKIINFTKKYIENTIDFEEYKKAYLTDSGTKNYYVSKKSYLTEEQERVYQINQHNLAEVLFKDSISLFDLSAAFTKIYKELKKQKNLLDFDDLILYTKKLFSSPETMGWILSQLDTNLNQILIDEAQDTSPAQWDILRMLSGDFFSEGDASGLPRSLFVVGDTKQSIYGFQGADPKAFASSREEISEHIKQNLRMIQEIPLEQSFRSLEPILRTVDAFFGNSEISQITGFVNNSHKAFRQDKGGLVEIHKLMAKKESEETTLDYIIKIADKIKSLIDDKQYLPRDIMVLVQRRNPFVSPLVKELKKRNIEVAGSDRIVLPEFPAIRDLLNLIRFCLDQTDDYSLCCVLKSPIFRLKEEEIFNICKIKNDENFARKKQNKNAILTTVFEVLETEQPEIYLKLKNIIGDAKSMGPYSFFSTLLNTDNVRKNMIAALGGQIIDPIEEFMTICLSYERTQPGTLRHFLKWFITGGSEIKRDMDSSSGVRIVTIHGSKGLEAPVIFLIDTIRTPEYEQIFPIPTENLPVIIQKESYNLPPAWLWAPKKKEESETRCVATDAFMKAKIAEYYRLLYVAMTRAKDRLYIYGYTAHKNPPELAWHTLLWRTLSNIPGAKTDEETIRITDDIK